ncbi:MAG: hypothetical protein ABIG30_02310 [Candidatus Aenigmatarchaeota archaeon]
MPIARRKFVKCAHPIDMVSTGLVGIDTGSASVWSAVEHGIKMYNEGRVSLHQLREAFMTLQDNYHSPAITKAFSLVDDLYRGQPTTVSLGQYARVSS